MATQPQPSFLAPERLYSIRGFQVASGVSATRLREARRAGIVIPMLEVGKRKFVRGIDGIAALEQMARLPKKSEAAQ